MKFFDPNTAKSSTKVRSNLAAEYAIGVEHATAALNRKNLEDGFESNSVCEAVNSANKTMKKSKAQKRASGKKQVLRSQLKLMNHVWSIKINLEVDKTNIGESVALLEDLKENVMPDVTKCILRKYPYIVKFMMRWKSYEGIFTGPKDDYDGRKVHEENSEKIRQLATEICNQFQVEFSADYENCICHPFFFHFQHELGVQGSDDTAFLENFNKQAGNFEQKTRGLDPEQLFMTTTD